MEESKNYGHQHPLLLQSSEDQIISNPSRVSAAECSRCGEKVSVPCFRCVDDCGFYLHKVCADAPSELNHSFHSDHPLVLMENSPYYGGWNCDFCEEEGKKFVYHCSCGSDYHIRCALFTFNMAQNNLKELEHVPLHPPLNSSKTEDGKLFIDFRTCFVCLEPLANYTYFSPKCGFNLHKKCAELPLKLNHMCHRHTLFLQFDTERLSCSICEAYKRTRFVYSCPPCKLVMHIECLSAPLVVEDNRHPHPLTPFPRRAPFVCDGCGTQGTYASYICATCNIILHERCISLPRIIRSKWHDHRLFHKYFLPHEFRSSDCMICHDEVLPEHGNYHCSYCNVVFHVNCVTEDEDSYFIVSEEEEDDEIYNQSSIIVLESNDAGEATKVKHFLHDHNLMLSHLVGEHENSCEGCMLPISDPFYRCSECDFLLHKACAELLQKKFVPYHTCRELFALVSGKAFTCILCEHAFNAFAYECLGCGRKTCLQCVIARTTGAQTCSKHEHPLLYYKDFRGKCHACGDTTRGAFRCKGCNFVLHDKCFLLPNSARHKCDKHLLSFAYRDGNTYSESYYCDICEKTRDPDHCFYHCATCDTSGHVDCVLGRYPFMKLGSSCEENHPHPRTLVKKMYYYPECSVCDKPCEDLALECTKSKCNTIVHWNCAVPGFLQRQERIFRSRN